MSIVARQSRWFSLVPLGSRHPLTPVIVLVALFSAGAKDPAAARQPAAGIAGSWRGVYLAYPQVTVLDITLTTAGAEIEGSVGFRLLEPDRRSATGPGGGRVRVRGAFDAAAGTFTLTPGEWIERPARPTRPLRIAGVFDPRSRTLAGRFDDHQGGNPYFVLTTSDRAEQVLLEPLRDAETSPGARNPGLRIGGRRLPLSGGADTDKIVRWASRLRAEYPNLDLRRTVMGQLYLHARNLFQDEHFKQHFGRTFDEMADSDRQKIGQALRDPKSGADLEPYRFLQSAFIGTGQFNAEDITIGVFAQRTLRAWRDAALGRLRAAPAARETLSELSAYGEAGEHALRDLWPSETQAFKTELATASTRVASPILQQWADDIVRNARGRDGLTQIVAAISQVSGRAAAAGAQVRTADRRGVAQPTAAASMLTPDALARLVTDEARAAVVATLRSGADALLPPLVDEARAQIRTFGAGAAALRAGSTWYASFTTTFNGFDSAPPVAAASAEFQARRSKDLAEGEKELTGRVKAASSEAQIAAIVREHLGVPADRSDPAGARMLAAVAERRGIVAEAAAQAEAEARSAVTFCKTVPEGEKLEAKEPSARDMCLALAGKFDAINEGLRGQEQTCKSGGYQNNPILALQCLQLCGASGGSCSVSVQLTRFEKIACEKAVGEAGYVCDYVMRMSASGGAVQQAMATVAPNGSVTQARFVQAANGWIQLPARRR